MLRLIIVFFCCFLIDCKTVSVSSPKDFKERQKQLFYEIDHKLVYQGCQELMRLYRNGELSDNIFYCDDAPAKYNELPEPIRLLQPTYVHVFDVMVDIGFSGENGMMQSLSCYSNEFGQPASHYGNAKGWGFRKEPFGMDNISGKESLDYLNERFEDFEMELIPGLDYEMSREEKQLTLEDVKQSNELMKMFFAGMQKTIAELAVKKQKLLYQTDHQELLKACREIIIRYNNGVFSSDKINIGQNQFEKDLKYIPEIILNLEPVYVWLNDDSVMVALIGGMDHAGAMAYMNSDHAEERDDSFKLIDGLWYYDDGLREADADYKDYLKSLQKEAIPYLDWKRKQTNLPIPDKMEHRK